MDHLKESVGSNVLFQHLEEDELRDVLDAMYGTDDIFWGSLLRPVLAPPHLMLDALSARVYRVLIGACIPMVCPIHVFRFPVNPKAGDVIIQQGDEGMATFQSFWTYAHAVSKRCTAPHAPCAMPYLVPMLVCLLRDADCGACNAIT